MLFVDYFCYCFGLGCLGILEFLWRVCLGRGCVCGFRLLEFAGYFGRFVHLVLEFDVLMFYCLLFC